MYYVFANRPSQYFTIKQHYGESFRGNKGSVPKFSVGLLFTSTAKFRAIVREYVIKNGRNVKFIKNEKDEVRVVCSARYLKWFM